MKSVIISQVMALALIAPWMNAQAASSYSCKGVKGSAGKLSVTLDANTVSVDGTYDEDGSGKFQSIDCRNGKKGNSARGFTYYSMTKDSKCRFDFVKIPVNLAAAGKGVVILNDSTGGDNHDWSGNLYVYFYCNSN